MANTKKNFSRVYDKNVRKIYRFIFLKVSSKETAQDLTSQTFLKAWEAFKKREGNPGEKIENPSAFLYQIARNLVVDFYREKGRLEMVSTENLSLADSETDLEKEASLRSDFNLARKALANLKDDYQNVIIWHYLDDMSTSKIAELLNKNEGAVRVMIHRALKRLRQELTDN